LRSIHWHFTPSSRRTSDGNQKEKKREEKKTKAKKRNRNESKEKKEKKAKDKERLTKGNERKGKPGELWKTVTLADSRRVFVTTIGYCTAVWT
jgi:uncharacterized membrane protein YdbT with pleckstrin-like domain